MKHIRDPKRPLGDTPSPADSPLGSRRSRVAARAKLEARGLPPSFTVIFRNSDGTECDSRRTKGGEVIRGADETYASFRHRVELERAKPRAIPIILIMEIFRDEGVNKIMAEQAESNVKFLEQSQARSTALQGNKTNLAPESRKWENNSGS